MSAGSNSGPRKILVAFDGSEHSLGALDEAVALAHATRAQVTLVTVVHQVPAIAGGYAAGPLPDVDYAVAGAQAALSAAKVSLASELPVQTLVRVGPTIDEILDAADEQGFDLIVAGASGPGDFDSTELGSTTQELLRRASVPVLVARNARTCGIPSCRLRRGYDSVQPAAHAELGEEPVIHAPPRPRRAPSRPRRTANGARHAGFSRRQRVEQPTPTDAMLALGSAATTWAARLVVLTFVLAVIGLGIELGVAEAIPFP